MAKREILLGNAEKTREYGERLAGKLHPGAVLLLNGELGAGKTTLVQGIAEGLGSADRVTSPSFALVNIYQGEYVIYHFDLYRLKDVTELEETGFYEMLESGGISIVEWASRFPQAMPQNAIRIEIKYLPEQEGRLLVIEANDENIGC